jgi:hypothetical protein
MDFNNFISPTSKQKITLDGKSLTSKIKAEKILTFKT